MSLETELKKLAVAAGRIADGIEALVGAESGFKTIETEPTAEGPGKDEERQEEESSGTEDSSTEESPSSSPTEPESTSGDDPVGEAPSKDEVRDALKAVGKRLDAGAAREILATVGGAKTLTDLDETKYSAVIKAANDAG